MKCEECKYETDGVICKNCGLVIDDRPIALNKNGYPPRRYDITTLHASEMWSWDHPLSPKIRKKSKGFNPKYQKRYKDYTYIKAYESISKLCASLQLSPMVKFEALNLFKGIRKLDPNFFKRVKMAPTYLACIKIACRINDFPIMNHQLAEAIDYKLSKDKTNISYMEKKFNRAYRDILKLYNLRLKTPEHPRFIDFVCITMDLPQDFIVDIHTLYTRLKRTFQPHFRIEGYILALIYLRGKEKYKLTLKMLEERFRTSSLTISNRKNEILKVIK